MKKTRGFSVVELIIVILIMGIIGAVAFSRFVSGSAFNASGAQTAIISVIHAAQQASLGRSNVAFEIDSAGDSWLFSAVSGSEVLRSMSVSTSNVILETGSTAASANTCANAFDTPVGNDFKIDFDSKGDLTAFTNSPISDMAGPSFNGVRICVNDDVSLSVCVSPAGYAYAGDCDD